MANTYQDCIVLLGDSITAQQYVDGSMQARFCDAYRRSLDILNRGFSGYNTRWVRALFDTIFAKRGAPGVPVIRLVTIWLGANDAVKEGLPQHISLQEFEANLRYMVDQLTDAGSPYAAAHEAGFNIVLVTPPPILLSMTGNDERIPERTKQYVEVVANLAAEYKDRQTEGGTWRIGLVNMYEAVVAKAGGDGEEMRPFLRDGLHLTTEGYGVFWDEYVKLVRNEFYGRGLNYDDWSDLPPRVPNWQDVDPEHPEHLPDQMKLPPIRGSHVQTFDKEARELGKEQPPQDEIKTGKGCQFL